MRHGARHCGLVSGGREFQYHPRLASAIAQIRAQRGAGGLKLALPTALCMKPRASSILAQCQAASDGSGSGSTTRDVAKQLVGQFVQSDTIVAVDSGDLCTAIIQEIGHSLSEGSLQSVSLVPSCDAAASEAAFVGVPQAMSADVTEVDVMFSEVDEVDVSSPKLAFVFGRRSEPAQPQIPRFRAVAKKAKAFVALLASEEQAVDRLGRDLPVLLDNEGWEDAAEEVDDIFVGDAEIWRRTADATPATSPKGDPNPYVSADGHTIIDVKFYGDFCLVEDSGVPYEKLVQEVMAISGVLSVGLMEGVATHVVISGRTADAKVAVFSKEELQEAAAAAEAQIKGELEKEQGA
eukprot:jgi/Ulvmu1/7909/UM004_0141.1